MARAGQLAGHAKAHARAKAIITVIESRLELERPGVTLNAAVDGRDGGCDGCLRPGPGGQGDGVPHGKLVVVMPRQTKAHPQCLAVVQRGDGRVGIDALAHLEIGHADMAREGRLTRPVIQIESGLFAGQAGDFDLAANVFKGRRREGAGGIP